MRDSIFIKGAKENNLNSVLITFQKSPAEKFIDNVVGLNTGVIIDSKITTDNLHNSGAVANVIGNNQGGVILYTHVTVNINDIGTNSSLFNAVDTSKAKTGNVITNSVIQSQVTINGMHTDISVKFGYLFNLLLAVFIDVTSNFLTSMHFSKISLLS